MYDKSELEWMKTIIAGRRLEKRVADLLEAGGIWSERERSSRLASLYVDEEYEEYEEASRDESASELARKLALGELEPGDSRFSGFAGLAELAVELRATVVKAAGLHPRPPADGRDKADFVRNLDGLYPRQLWIGSAGYSLVEIVHSGRRAHFFASAKGGMSPRRLLGFAEHHDDSKVRPELIEAHLGRTSFADVLGLLPRSLLGSRSATVSWQTHFGASAGAGTLGPSRAASERTRRRIISAGEGTVRRSELHAGLADCSGFDAGLVDGNGAPRPAYGTLKNALGRFAR